MFNFFVFLCVQWFVEVMVFVGLVFMFVVYVQQVVKLVGEVEQFECVVVIVNKWLEFECVVVGLVIVLQGVQFEVLGVKDQEDMLKFMFGVQFNKGDIFFNMIIICGIGIEIINEGSGGQ